MKKTIFLILCFSLFIMSWRYYQETTTSTHEKFQKQKIKIISPLSEHKNVIKAFKEVKMSKTLPKKTITTPKKISSASISARDFDEKKMVISDELGNIYPTELNVTKDFIVAFGDLIVGDARDVDAIKNGEKVLSLPYPKLWPNGVIPILVSQEIKRSEQFQWIQEIMLELKNKANIEIRFADPMKDKARVNITRGNEHCYAQVGHTGEVTQMSLSKNCSKVAIYHEFFHILGFYHEQNRFDREEYLKILWENIDEIYWPQFKLFPENSFQRVYTTGGPFEFSFDTIMIYGSTFFSSNQDYSMVRIDGTPFNSKFDAPTERDISRLIELYSEEIPR